MRDFLGAGDASCLRAIAEGKARSRQPRFDTVRLAAPAMSPLVRYAVPSGIAMPRKRIVAPFSGNCIGARANLAVNDETTAGPGAENDAENHAKPTGRAVDCLRKGETIGVIGDADLPLQKIL